MARISRDGPSETLEETNWPTWSVQMRSFLSIKGCARWVTVELPPDADENEVENAELALDWIRLCISVRWQRRIRQVVSPFAAWQAFLQHYHDHLRLNLLDYQAQIFEMRQGASQSVDC